MNNRLFIGNLDYNAEEKDLIKVLSPFGEIEFLEIIIDRYTMRSKGFAFVTMKDPDDARRALRDLQGKDLLGRPMKLAPYSEQK